jgi:hypothetical protein
VVAQGDDIEVGGIALEYEAKRTTAKRDAVVRNWPSDKAQQTRGKLKMEPEPERVNVVFKCKNEGANWRITKYGSAIRASALEVVED